MLYNIYLIGIYDNTKRLKSVKIGQTTQSVNKRLSSIKAYAKISNSTYNKGEHKLLTYITCDGENCGLIVESGIHYYMQAKHNTIKKYKGAKDYFRLLRNFNEKTLINWFNDCIMQVIKENNFTIQ